MIHFNNTTGKNKGKLQITKLAKYLNKSESALRAIRNKDDRYLDILHLGSLCTTNSISKEDLNGIVASGGKSSCVFIKDSQEFPRGYAFDLIIHNLGWCLCNTSREDFINHIKIVEKDLFDAVVRDFISEAKLQDVIKIAYSNKDSFRCTAVPILKNNLGIKPCFIEYASSMVRSVSNIVSYGKPERESKIFGWMSRKMSQNIEEFYMAYFRICDNNYSYTQVLKHFKKEKKD